MPSSAVAAQDAFVDLLQAAAAFDDATVIWGGSGKLPKAMDLVVVLPVRNYRLEPGEQFRTEFYDLAAQFWVARTGETSGDEADARRWALIDAADEELRRTDFHGYGSRGGDLAVVEESLDLYDKGWIAASVVTFGTETWTR